MKKTLLVLLMAMPLFLAPWACRRPVNIGPIPTPTPTLTPITTPLCGFTPIELGERSVYAGPNVIRSYSDWRTFCSYPVGLLLTTPTVTPTIPAPPVDFSKQMIIVYMDVGCPPPVYTVNDVCEGPTQITVYGTRVEPCVFCNVASFTGSAHGLVVPQSNLPVVSQDTVIPCSWLLVTPTPTP